MDTYFGDDEEESAWKRYARERRCEAPAGARGLVASEPQAESRLGCVGLPVFLRYRETSMMVVLNERAQARNLGGTAKAAFRPKAGREAAFLTIRRSERFR